jgi:SAM-dependent methyltransferase
VVVLDFQSYQKKICFFLNLLEKDYYVNYSIKKAKEDVSIFYTRCEKLGLNKKKKFLVDFGCGPGLWSIYFSTLGHHVYAYEVNDKFIKILEYLKDKLKLNNLIIIKDINDLYNKKIDLMISHSVIHLSADINYFLTNFKKISNKKTKLYFSYSGYGFRIANLYNNYKSQNTENIVSSLKGFVGGIITSANIHDHNFPKINLYRESELKKILSNNQINIIKPLYINDSQNMIFNNMLVHDYICDFHANQENIDKFETNDDLKQMIKDFLNEKFKITKYSNNETLKQNHLIEIYILQAYYMYTQNQNFISHLENFFIKLENKQIKI